MYDTVASGSLDALRSALAEAEGLGLYYSEAADQARAAISALTRDFTSVRGATIALEHALEHALLRPSSRSCLARSPVHAARVGGKRVLDVDAPGMRRAL